MASPDNLEVVLSKYEWVSGILQEHVLAKFSHDVARVVEETANKVSGRLQLLRSELLCRCRVEGIMH